MRKINKSGFSELEFLGLVAAGLLVVGLLAHFAFDQTIQVERLNALVQRDGVRLNLESNLTNAEVLKKSVQRLTDTPENRKIRACVLGLSEVQGCSDGKCCTSRERYSIPIVKLGEESGVISGSSAAPSCLDEKGEPMTGECFASSSVSIEPVCAEGAATCKQALAVLIHYQIQFEPAVFKTEGNALNVDRTLSVLLSPH